MVKKVIFLVFSLAVPVMPAGTIGLPELTDLRASDLLDAPAVIAVAPPPAARADDPQAPQDLVKRFNSAGDRLYALSGELVWVPEHMNGLERRARQISQFDTYDAFFQNDLRGISSDMSRRFEEMRRLSLELRDLLPLAVGSKELNEAAVRIDQAARDILRRTWPGMVDAAQRLEWTVRSCKPELVGYDAQWTAMDVSRFTRQLSDQARNASIDAAELVKKTRP